MIHYWARNPWALLSHPLPTAVLCRWQIKSFFLFVNYNLIACQNAWDLRIKSCASAVCETSGRNSRNGFHSDAGKLPVWNGKAVFHSTLSVMGGVEYTAFHSALSTDYSSGMLHTYLFSCTVARSWGQFPAGHPQMQHVHRSKVPLHSAFLQVSQKAVDTNQLVRSYLSKVQLWMSITTNHNYCQTNILGGGGGGVVVQVVDLVIRRHWRSPIF